MPQQSKRNSDYRLDRSRSNLDQTCFDLHRTNNPHPLGEFYSFSCRFELSRKKQAGSSTLWSQRMLRRSECRPCENHLLVFVGAFILPIYRVATKHGFTGKRSLRRFRKNALFYDQRVKFQLRHPLSLAASPSFVPFRHPCHHNLTHPNSRSLSLRSRNHQQLRRNLPEVTSFPRYSA